MDKNTHEGKKDAEVYLSLGSNIGDREDYLHRARVKLAQLGEVVQVSRIYESAPWKMQSTKPFLNQCLNLRTAFEPQQLLIHLKQIEEDLGRTQSKSASGYLDRTIDIDILYYDHVILNSEHLTVPHPHIQDRKFVLIPLSELAPDFVHPKLDQTNAALLAKSSDQGKIQSI